MSRDGRRQEYTRREVLRLAAAGLAVHTASAGWLKALAADAAADPRRRRGCILLWMNGGPSQIDTFDMKPGHENGGQFKEIATSVARLRFCEHLTKLAARAEQLAVLRSLSTKEGDHGRGTYLMRTGHTPDPTLRYPTLGSLVSKQLGAAEDELPSYVSIVPFQTLSPAAYSPGFLGP